MGKITTKERGWAGHFIAAEHCLFRRNTLIKQTKGKSYIVSTVGAYKLNNKIEKIGYTHYYETLVFESKTKNGYTEADVTKEIKINNPQFIKEMKKESDKKADEMHERIIKEIVNKLTKNIKIKYIYE